MQAMLGKSRLVAHGKTVSAMPRVNTPRTATSGMLNSSEATNNNYQSHANTLMVSSGRVSTAVNTQGGMRIIQGSGSVGARKRY